MPVHEPDLAALHAPLAEGRGGPAGLYLRGLSTGDFRPALEGCSGRRPRGCRRLRNSRYSSSQTPVSRAMFVGSVKEGDYLYVWADGVHFNVWLEEERLCTLVLIGARADGQKELIAGRGRLPRECAERGGCPLSSVRAWTLGADSGAGLNGALTDGEMGCRRRPWMRGPALLFIGPFGQQLIDLFFVQRKNRAPTIILTRRRLNVAPTERALVVGKLD